MFLSAHKFVHGREIGNCNRIHKRDALRCRELHDANLWPVGFFADEFRIEREERLRFHMLEKLGERSCIIDPLHIALRNECVCERRRGALSIIM